MRVIGNTWFTAWENTIGVVLINDGFEDKAYIDVVEGILEEDDVKKIINYGARFPVDAARLLLGVK
jgi:hypothetical protein